MADSDMLTISKKDFIEGLDRVLHLNKNDVRLTHQQIAYAFNIDLGTPRVPQTQPLCLYYTGNCDGLCVRNAKPSGFCSNHTAKSCHLYQVKAGPRLGYCMYPKQWIGDDYVLKHKRYGLCSKVIEKGEFFCEDCKKEPQFEERSVIFITDKDL